MPLPADVQVAINAPRRSEKKFDFEQDVGSESEPHFHCAATFREAAFVAQVVHQVEAAPAAFFQTLWAGRVGHLFGVETRAFIRYPYGQRIAQMPKGNTDSFGTITSVAVQNGIGDGFSEADEDVAMCVRRKVIALGYGLDKRLNSGNISGVRR